MVCEHKNYACSVAVTSYDGKRVAELSVKCIDCGRPFHYLGVEDVGVSMTGPALSPNSEVLHIPITPAPSQAELDTPPLDLSVN